MLLADAEGGGEGTELGGGDGCVGAGVGDGGALRSSTVIALPEVIPSETTGSPSEPETSFGGNPALSCALQDS